MGARATTNEGNGRDPEPIILVGSELDRFQLLGVDAHRFGRPAQLTGTPRVGRPGGTAIVGTGTGMPTRRSDRRGG